MASRTMVIDFKEWKDIHEELDISIARQNPDIIIARRAMTSDVMAHYNIQSYNFCPIIEGGERTTTCIKIVFRTQKSMMEFILQRNVTDV